MSIVYFTIGPSTIDTDNMIKPVLDALNRVIWLDDSQISEVIARKTDRLALTSLKDPPPDVAAALEIQRPFIYVRVKRMMGHEELPR